LTSKVITSKLSSFPCLKRYFDVSLRILFADDSVTAQNMGKKILTDAGYEVVAVSNGAAAVKKIAEQKPDIIILDVYMPGYSGLEVCEKVRASIATLKTPVLLTVGKMEPYKPEDANRVRADGVIIKPFEASDLLAIIKKFEERIGEVPPPPLVQQTQASRGEGPSTEVLEAQVEQAEPAAPLSSHAMLEVPDHMATSSAFSDLLGSEPSHASDSFNVAIPQRVPETTPAAGPSIAAAAIQDYDLPLSWRNESEPVLSVVAAPVAPEPVLGQPIIAETAAAADERPGTVPTPEETGVRPLQIPVYKEPESSSYEMIATAAAPTGDIEIPREPELQETAEEVTRNTVADHREPGLMDTPHMQPEPPSSFRYISPISSATAAEPAVVGHQPAETLEAETASAEPEAIERPALAVVTDSEFEARVAAAMAAYSPSAESREMAARSEHLIPEFTSQLQHESVQLEPTTEAAAEEPIAEPSIASEPVPAPQAGELAAVTHGSVAAQVEEMLPQAAAAAAAGTGTEHENIAQAVHRVMERIKGDLVEEIVRELKSRK
jgi:CheY-like chemotaxis protein